MANYPKELTDLVAEYLTDGILTGKERSVLLKKAESLGVDTDEFDLYLDAQQQKVDQVADAAARKTKGKTCPYCGAPVPQLADKCPECGRYITAEASKELAEILENLEDALVDFKAGRDIERNKAKVEKYSRRARMYYSSHPKVSAMLEEVNNELSAGVSAAKKRARNEKIINATLKNKWFWGAMPIVLGIIFAMLAFTISSGVGMIMFIIGCFSVLVGIVAISIMASPKDK